MRRSSSRRQRKSIPKLRPTPLHGKPRRRKRRAYAHFGWPRKQPTRILQIAAPRQRRPGDLSRAGAFENLRPPPQNPVRLGSESFQDGCAGCREAIRTARLVCADGGQCGGREIWYRRIQSRVAKTWRKDIAPTLATLFIFYSSSGDQSRDRLGSQKAIRLGSEGSRLPEKGSLLGHG